MRILFCEARFKKIFWAIITIFLVSSISLIIFEYKTNLSQILTENQEFSKLTIDSIEFPKDEGVHQDMVQEWWYFKAHLKDRFNPQTTFGTTVIFFKNGMSYLVVVDVKNQKKYSSVVKNSFDVLSQNKLSLKNGENYWIETDLFEYRLRYYYQGIGLDFILKSLKNPMIVSSEPKSLRGLYLVQPRIDVQGELNLEDKKYEVNGWGWIDHQAFTVSVPELILGWKWWAVQLNNNTELMFDDILFAKEKRSDLKQHPLLIFDKDSSGFDIEKIDRDQYILKELDYWEDPRTNTRYPISWSLEIPVKNISLEINSVLKDQIIEGTSIYEGTCRVDGIYEGLEVEGWAQFENVYKNIQI